MLIRFKSKASADVIMLDVHAKWMLEMMGKQNIEKGIVCAADLPEVMQRLAQALQDEQKRPHDPPQQDAKRSDGSAQEVSWAQRAQPLQKMLRLALKHQASVVWSN